MSDVNELLKKVSAKLEEVSGTFSQKAEDALKEAKNSGQLSAQTKEAVDKIATEFNALTEANKSLKASLGDLEQHVAQMPLASAKGVIETVGSQVISSEALKAFSASIEGNKRLSIKLAAGFIDAGSNLLQYFIYFRHC